MTTCSSFHQPLRYFIQGRLLSVLFEHLIPSLTVGVESVSIHTLLYARGSLGG
jgi:hypothetical protein